MEQRNEGIPTFSVRQLALLFGRSEQTIRRWKDQGKLTAGLGTDDTEGETQGGSLVFTIDAVREFVRKNPRVMDKARPEIVVELLGEAQGASIHKTAAEEKPNTGKAMGGAAALLASTALLGPAGLGLAGAVIAGSSLLSKTKSGQTGAGKSAYLYQLLLDREAAVNQELAVLEQEQEQIAAEKSNMEAESDYLTQLLQARETVVTELCEGLKKELKQIEAEKTRIDQTEES